MASVPARVLSHGGVEVRRGHAVVTRRCRLHRRTQSDAFARAALTSARSALALGREILGGGEAEYERLGEPARVAAHRDAAGIDARRPEPLDADDSGIPVDL